MVQVTGKTGFHETFDRQEAVKGSSNRSFGLIVGGILVAIAGYRLFREPVIDPLSAGLLAVGGPLVLLGLVLPAPLAPLNRAWLQLGLCLSRIGNPLVMALIFYVTISPIGLAMRLAGKDPLQRRWSSAARSYWIPRSPPGPGPESMTQQF